MFAVLALAAALDASAFAYNSAAALNLTYGAATQRLGVVMKDVRFSSAGRTVRGVIAQGRGNGKHPAVLFVHWLGDEATTNHTEFEDDAARLAQRGVTSLLIDAMWSEKDWFDKGRSTQTDYQRSIEQVIDLRRSLDALLAQPNVDAARVAYVGHDFGSMYGAILAGVDPRPQWYVLMAGTTSFSEWYLLGRKPADVQAYVAQMAPLDPGNYLARAKARGFLFQFSAHDRYVTPTHALEFFQSAPLPRAMALYDADHSLATPVAAQDRLAWLIEKLHP
jgi:fermentation-respiration switch protein FrsA (DUF1100 family)